MRLRVSDRILVSLAGLLLIAAGAGLAAQMYFQVDLLELAGKVFSSDSVQIRLGVTVFAVVLVVLGLYCLLVLFRHRRRRDKFILQKSDSGDLAISIKALENMVQKCVDQHPEVQVQRMYLENRKDGLLIRLRGSIAGGISIPLTVEAMQKQIRQYVTACSGVEVRGIRVQIESSGDDAENAPFAIAAPAGKPLLKEGEEKQTPVQNRDTKEIPQSVPAPVTETPESVPVTKPVSAEPMVSPIDEEDDRPLHQRLFSSQPEPCIVPEPPVEADNFITAGPEPETGVAAETEGSAEADAETETEIAEEAENSITTDAEPDTGITAEPEDPAEADADITEEIPVTEEGPEETEESAEETEIFRERETNPDLPTEDKPEASEQLSEEKKGADPDFLESLSAFDRIVTGGKGLEG